MKDNFSNHAKEYALFRPSYPADAISFILSLIDTKTVAWDCGTGNGQLAVKLSNVFQTVYATDISKNQIDNAEKKENIRYEVVSAEDVSFQQDSFDLITVAQAIHWFDFEKFYDKVRFTLKQDGIIAVIGYNLMTIDEPCNRVIRHLYSDILGDTYWDKERKYLDEQYQTIPFPFQEITTPALVKK